MTDPELFDDSLDESAAALERALGQAPAANDPEPAPEPDPEPEPEPEPAVEPETPDEDPEPEADQDPDPAPAIAEPATPPVAATPEKAAAAPAKEPESAPEAGETYDQMMDRLAAAKDRNTLSEADRSILSAIDTLKAQQTGVTEIEAQVKAGVEKEATIKVSMDRVQLLIADAKADLEEDDLNADAQRRLEKHQKALRDLKEELRDHVTNQTRLETKAERDRRKLDDEILRLDESARALHGRVQTQRTKETRTKGLQDVWQTGLANAFATHDNAMVTRKERKFDKDERDTITEGYEKALNAYIRDHDGPPPDLAKWIADQSAPFERAQRIRRNAGSQVAKRTADLEPRRPTDAKAPRPSSQPKGERVRTFEDEFEASGQKLDRLLRAG